MATSSVNFRPKYSALIRKLFPQGWAWNLGATFKELLDALAYEPARIEARGVDFIDELDPNTTFEMLENWERLLFIPDECTPPGEVSLYQRRVRVLQKLTTGGGQSIAFFKLIAAQLGYDADIIDVKNYSDFRAGKSRAGDALNNSTLPGGGPSATGWAYTFQIKAPAALVRYFRAGQGAAGDRLVIFQNDTLECVIRKFAPAHVTVLFNFGE